MNDFAHYQSLNPIAQLKELQTNRRFRMLEDQLLKRDEEWSYLCDLKKIVPHIDITRDSVDDTFSREMSKNLMMSEWMMEEPQDLEDFILVPVPKGTRGTLLFMPEEKKRNQLAKVYCHTGHKLFEVRTNIPPETILDIIWVKKNNTIYILDCMMYDGRDLTNCDTAFRRYWIGSKFFECRLGVMDVRVPQNNMKLNFIEGFEFKQPHRVHHCFQHIPCFEDYGAELDGFLFYHKDASYTPGETPLVMWLFPYMVDEVLTMFRVHPDYNCLKPDGYTNYMDHIEKFKEKERQKEQKKEQARKRRQDTKGNGGRANSSGINEIRFDKAESSGSGKLKSDTGNERSFNRNGRNGSEDRDGWYNSNDGNRRNFQNSNNSNNRNRGNFSGRGRRQQNFFNDYDFY